MRIFPLWIFAAMLAATPLSASAPIRTIASSKALATPLQLVGWLAARAG